MKKIILAIVFFLSFTTQANVFDDDQWSLDTNNTAYVVGRSISGAMLANSEGEMINMLLVISTKNTLLPVLEIMGDGVGCAEYSSEVTPNQPLKFNDQWIKIKTQCAGDGLLHFSPSTNKGVNHIITTMLSARHVTWYTETGDFISNFSASGFTAAYEKLLENISSAEKKKQNSSKNAI